MARKKSGGGKDHHDGSGAHGDAAGEPPSGDALFEHAYERLRRFVNQFMARQAHGRTLQPTEVLHEAFLRVRGQIASVKDEVELTRLLAGVFTHVVIDHARARTARKRGGHNWVRMPIDLDALSAPGRDVHLVDLGDALEQLAAAHPQAAQVVELHFFAGLSFDESAIVVGTSRSKSVREWEFAKAWLMRALEGGHGRPRHRDGHAGEQSRRQTGGR